MKTIYVNFTDPNNLIMDPPVILDDSLKRLCFTAFKYRTPFEALEAYANTRCTWSTLLEDSTNVAEFIDEAWEHIKAHDEDWLEANFT